MPSCSVNSCKNSSATTKNRRIGYFKVPDDGRKKAWLDFCDRNTDNLKDVRICSDHFRPEFITKSSELLAQYGLQVYLKVTSSAIPTEKPLVQNIVKKRYRSKSLSEPPAKRQKTPENAEPTFIEESIDVNFKRSETTVAGCDNSTSLSKFDEIVQSRDETSVKNETQRLDQGESVPSLSSNSATFSSEAIGNTDDLHPKIYLHASEINLDQEKICFSQESSRVIIDRNHPDYSVQAEIRKKNIEDEVIKLKAALEKYQQENVLLKNENENLQREKKINSNEIKTLKKDLKQQQKSISKEIERKVYEILKPIFTTGQIKKLLHPNQKVVKWSVEDIASAIALRSVTPKGYRYLRRKGVPLPALSTLRKLASKITVDPRILSTVIKLMKAKGKEGQLMRHNY